MNPPGNPGGNPADIYRNPFRVKITGRTLVESGDYAGWWFHDWVEQTIIPESAFDQDAIPPRTGKYIAAGTDGEQLIQPAVEINNSPADPGTFVFLRPRAVSQGWLIFEFDLGMPTEEWFWVRITGGSDAGGYSGVRVYLLGPDTWMEASPPEIFTGNLWRAPSNRVLPELPPIAPNQVVLCRLSLTYGEGTVGVEGTDPDVTGEDSQNYEITPWGSQNHTAFTVTGADCKGYQVDQWSRDLRTVVTPLSPPPPAPPPPPPPVIGLTASMVGQDPPSGPYPTGSSFHIAVIDIAGGTPPYSVAYDNGAGGTGTGASFGVTYSTAGSYFPTATVTDSSTPALVSPLLMCSNGNGSGRYDIIDDAGPIRSRSVQRAGNDIPSTSTTLAAAFTVPLAGDTEYKITGDITINPSAGGGYKLTIGGSCTVINISWRYKRNLDTARIDMGSDEIIVFGTVPSHLDVAGSSVTEAHLEITGSVYTDDPGDLELLFAQHAASGTSNIAAGSTFTVEPVTGGYA